MKFNKPLLIFTCLSLLLMGCAHESEKKSAEKSPKVAPAVAAPESPATATPASVAVPASVLPVGPATPNPYLQTTQKFSEQIEINFHDAVSAMEQKNWTHAQAVLEPLAANNPSLSGVQLNLGIVYREQGQKDKAADAFNRAIKANFKNVAAYNQLAVLKREGGDFAGAETLYKKALDIWPFYPEGHKNIAILYELYLAKPEQALPHYLAYQQLLPAPDKQVDSWVADLQRRVNGAKKPTEGAQ